MLGIAAAVLALALPSAAFDLPFFEVLKEGRRELAAPRPADDAASLKAALLAMQAYPYRPGAAVAPEIVEFLRWVRVDFHNGGPAVGYGYIRPEGYPAYYLLTVSRGLVAPPEDALGQAYFAATLADGASRLMDIEQPESAEREHMRLSRKLRVWIELNEAATPGGGEPWARLDVLSEKDRELAEYAPWWIEHCGPYGSKPCDPAELSGKLGKPSLSKLLEDNKRLQTSLAAQLAKETGASARYYRDALERAQAEQRRMLEFQRAFLAFRSGESAWGRFQGF